MKLFIAAICQILLVLAIGFATAELNYIERDQPIDIPQGWKYDAQTPVNPDRKHVLLFAIKQRNVATLPALLKQVADPTQTATYGHHYTIDQLTQIVSPRPEALAAVQHFVAQHGITTDRTTLTANRDFLRVQTTISVAQRMMNTQFHRFTNEKGQVIVRSIGPYGCDSAVAQHLDFVTGVTNFPVKKTYIRQQDIPEDTAAVNPQFLRQAYSVPASAMGGSKNNSFSVAEFQGQYYSPSDLTQFFKQYVTDKTATDTVTKVIGTNSAGDPGVEASLDIQYIMGVGLNIPAWFYSNPSFDFFTDLSAWAALLSNTKDTPWVHSVSYGDQKENHQSSSYKDRLDAEFVKLGMRGISIIFASGDSGCGCELCFEFHASYPATSPHVTSVGATRFIDGTSTGKEAAVEAFHSGGGFSKFFKVQDYQSAAVSHYLSTAKLPSAHYFNAKGRGTPDVSAAGIGFQVVVNGATQSVGGTSCSAPTFSGIVGLLNELRLTAHKAPLGFLNYWIYQNAASFTDIVVGDNSHACCPGFKTAPGWDPVTGVGTPNYAMLAKSVMALP